MTDLEMFLNFRKEIDTLAFPLLQEYGDFVPIIYDNQKVGFLLVIDGYVEGIWVQPEYRRKGLAKKAVLDYINNGGEINILDVVKTNVSADLFWNSIFVMEQLHTTFCDKRYRVLGVKENESDNM